MTPVLVAQEPIDENVMKAVYIKTIIPYITWNGEQENTHFRIAFLGKPKVGTFLQKILENDSVNSKKVTFLTISPKDLYKPYDIVIVEDGLTGRVEKIHPYTFSISDSNTKVDAKKMILKFKMIDERLKFIVNFKALKKSKIKLSSRLLKIAYSEGKNN